MTKLDIINNAMLKCGLPLAASLEDADYNAMQVYEVSVDEALSTYAWSFARAHRKLELAENAADFGNRHAYHLPDDYISMIDCRSKGDLRSPKAQEVERAGKYIYCQINPCFLRYTRRVTDPDEWSSSFAEAVSALIAVKICALSAEKIQLQPQLLQAYTLQLSIAQARDARETHTRLPEINPFIDARDVKG